MTVGIGADINLTLDHDRRRQAVQYDLARGAALIAGEIARRDVDLVNAFGECDGLVKIIVGIGGNAADIVVKVEQQAWHRFADVTAYDLLRFVGLQIVGRRVDNHHRGDRIDGKVDLGRIRNLTCGIRDGRANSYLTFG